MLMVNIFYNFLIDSNCCVLNGRVDPQKNNFTSVSAKGKAAVDYFAVPYTSLQYITGFEIIRSSCLVNLEFKDMGFESRHVPDHSLLKCSIEVLATKTRINAKYRMCLLLNLTVASFHQAFVKMKILFHH